MAPRLDGIGRTAGFRDLHFQEPLGSGAAQPLPPRIEHRCGKAALPAKCLHGLAAAALLQYQAVPPGSYLGFRLSHTSTVSHDAAAHKMGFT